MRKIIFLIILVSAISLHGKDQSYGVNMDMPTNDSILLTDVTLFGYHSLRFSSETIRLLADETYRQSVYPESYGKVQLLQALQERKLQYALWILINLNLSQPDLVEPVVFKLAQSGIGLAYYLDAFYSYAFADPEVFDFETEEVYVKDPLLLELKLASARSLSLSGQRFMDLSSDPGTKPTH
ncbi:MAG: hypothetical protein HKN76_00140 [Saprospiraceae bacterium]|nr:hypothetical protein [Saprospiraceae bacterium]